MSLVDLDSHDRPRGDRDGRCFFSDFFVLEVIERLVDRGLSVVATEPSGRVLRLPRGKAPIFGPTAETITEENLTCLFGVRVRIHAVPTPEKIVTAWQP